MSTIADRITEGLSPAQRTAVLAPDRYVRIMAGAGAGKTETLTRRIIWLLAQGARPADIVAFTFTERAAASMKDRIYDRVQQLLGPAYMQNLGEMFVGTIHAYSARLLQDHFGYGNWDVLDENQEMAFLLQRGWELGFWDAARHLRTSYSEYVERFKRSEAVVCDEVLDLHTVVGAPDAHDFPDQVRGYWVLLDKERILTFSRMVRLAAEHLRNNPGVAQCRHLIVDEYQDINRAQETLIQALVDAPGFETCTVVGDPRQCIYEWRGSDPGCFDRFARRYPARTVLLSENRRSVQQVIAIANRVAGHFDEVVLREPMTEVRRWAGLVAYQESETPQDEARLVTRLIRELVGSGQIRYADVAVLLRSVSTSGAAFVATFQAEGIPYLVGGRIGLFQRPEARAMAALWLWFADHGWRPDGWGGHEYRGDTLLDLVERNWPGSVPRDELPMFRERLLNGQYRNLTDAYHDLLVRFGFLEWDPTHPESAARIANLARFSRLLVDFEAAAWRGGRRPQWRALLNRLAWYITTYAQGAYAEQQADDLPQVDAVQLTTIHQAKGLEWPVVFVPALVERRFPSSRVGSPQPWLLDRHLFDANRYEGDVNTERRLFYVAVTRARDLLLLSRFRRTNARGARPSPFLAEAGVRRVESDAVRSLLQGAVERGRELDGEIVSLTVDQILNYLRCPHQYRMRHVWGFEPELASEIGYGRAVHHVLRVLAQRARDGEDPAAVLPQVLEEAFHLPYANRRGRDQMLAAARRGLESYVRQHGESLRRAEQVETRLEFQLTPAVTVTGRADVLLTDGGALEIVDYKTVAPGADDGLSDQEADLQVQLYAAGLERTGREVRAARVVHVLAPGHPSRNVPVDGRSLRRARQQAEACVQGVLDRKFPSEPGPACRSCDVRRICAAAER